MSDFQFKQDPNLPATIGWGPGVRIVRDDVLLGWVRRMNPEAAGRPRWMVYRLDGSEAGISNQRQTAANWLKSEADRERTA